MRKLILVLVFLFCGSPVWAQSGMLTARQHYDTVLAEVRANHGDDVRLMMVMALYSLGGIPVSLDYENGAAELWMYGFLSPSDQQLVTGLAVDNEILGKMIGEVSSDLWPEGSDSIYVEISEQWWVDSDSAAAVWSTMSVKDFMDSRPSAYPIGLMLTTFSGEESHQVQWGIVAVDEPDTISCSLDAVTTEPLECMTTTSVVDLTNAVGFHLDEAYPNPVRSGQFAEINLTSTTANSLQVEVYDAQGRLRGLVLDEHLSPGSRKIIIPSELIDLPGVYFIQARSASGMVTKKFVVTR